MCYMANEGHLYSNVSRPFLPLVGLTTERSALWHGSVRASFVYRGARVRTCVGNTRIIYVRVLRVVCTSCWVTAGCVSTLVLYVGLARMCVICVRRVRTYVHACMRARGGGATSQILRRKAAWRRAFQRDTAESVVAERAARILRLCSYVHPMYMPRV